jgi:putative mRNA 3-end processing factor
MLITFTDNGLYCPEGKFYIDPWKPVDAAVITHGHSDHARAGSRHYLCHHKSLPILRTRLGEHDFQAIGWNEAVMRNGVKVSLHPAGHIIGSSQVRVEFRGEVWVISGDYKTEDDGISGAFEPVRCHTFVTESTFGLPVYKWEPQRKIYHEMLHWVEQNRRDGFSSVFQAYSLGKAQRLLDSLREYEGSIFAHGAVLNMQAALRSDGCYLPQAERLTTLTPPDKRKNCIYITPAPVGQGGVSRLLGAFRSAACSGWMQVRGNRRRHDADKGFVLSDHADWNGLLQAVRATGAEKVFVTHGFQSAFSRYLTETGIEAAEVSTRFGEEETETADAVNTGQNETP